MFAREKQTVQVKGYQYAGTVRKQTALSCLTITRLYPTARVLKLKQTQLGSTLHSIHCHLSN